MPTVTISPKFEITIPKSVHKAMQLRPGHRLNILDYDGRIIMIPDKNIAKLKSFLEGINLTFKRDKGRI
jgi:AbrB family looped-hinge helix DNA binding protein